MDAFSWPTESLTHALSSPHRERDGIVKSWEKCTKAIHPLRILLSQRLGSTDHSYLAKLDLFVDII